MLQELCKLQRNLFSQRGLRFCHLVPPDSSLPKCVVTYGAIGWLACPL